MTVADAADRSLRVMFAVRPYRGHLHPLIPLARAFSHAGHRVAVATSDDVADIVVGAGLVWLPAGINPRDIPEISPRADPDYGYQPVRAKVDDMLGFAIGDFRPDVIVRDPTDLAPIIVSEIVGAVNVIYGLSRFIPRKSWEILGADRTITRLRRDFALPPDPELACMFSDLYLAVIPEPLEVERPLPVPAVQPLRYVPWDGDVQASAVAAPRRTSTRPLILVTLGTVYNSEAELFARFLEALADEDVDVICTLGDGADPGLLDNAPRSVRFERYLPHSSILPDCAALLCHGGFNTVMGSLLAGVPLVCVPLGSDHDYNAALCQRMGFGLSLDPEEATPDRLREAVRRIIRERSFSESVRTFQRQLAAVPDSAAAVRRIERLVALRRPVPA